MLCSESGVCIFVDDEDFVSVRREVQFGAGQLRKCLSIIILDDSIMEKTEDFLLVVESQPSNELLIEGLLVAPAITDICITDNDSKFDNTVVLDI